MTADEAAALLEAVRALQQAVELWGLRLLSVVSLCAGCVIGCAVLWALEELFKHD